MPIQAEWTVDLPWLGGLQHATLGHTDRPRWSGTSRAEWGLEKRTKILPWARLGPAPTALGKALGQLSPLPPAAGLETPVTGL